VLGEFEGGDLGGNQIKAKLAGSMQRSLGWREK
jgi:hypothetical protein